MTKSGRWLSMDVAGRGDLGDSATKLYINVVLISSAKVAVIARGHLTGLFLVWFCFDFSRL